MAIRTSMQVPYPQGLALPRAAQRRQSPQQKMVEGLVQPEVWTMYDSAIISPGAAGAFQAFANFANVAANIPFFNFRTLANTNEALTSMTTNSGYVDFPYKAYGIGVDVWADADAPGGAAQFVGRQFIEAVVNGGAVSLKFATDAKLIMPIADLPAGGGVVYSDATDARALAVNQTSGSASNGVQSVQARVLWKDYILFKGRDTPFTLSVILSPVALARIQALTALTGNFSAGIRVKFWGYRGKSLITGAPYRG